MESHQGESEKLSPFFLQNEEKLDVIAPIHSRPMFLAL